MVGTSLSSKIGTQVRGQESIKIIGKRLTLIPTTHPRIALIKLTITGSPKVVVTGEVISRITNGRQIIIKATILIILQMIHAEGDIQTFTLNKIMYKFKYQSVKTTIIFYL